jgi:hypothetical protein
MRRLLAFLRPDEGVLVSLIGRLVALASGPVTLLLLATRFSPVYQGFYYTFTSITALTILLELGLGTVLTQFASHEFAHLHWLPNGALTGEERPLAHLVGILVKAYRWYSVVAGLAVLIFIPMGLAFFSAQGHAEQVDYVWPWVWLVSLTATGLLAVPLTSVIEGCGRVADVMRLRLLQSVVANAFLWSGILSHQALYAAALAAAGPVIVPAIWFTTRYHGLVRQIRTGFTAHTDAEISWRDELLPMQWRIALSWLAGFLTFSLFNPLLFRYQGAVVAGQMGMSLTLANAPFALAMSWLAARVPSYGTLIRMRRWSDLDALARKASTQALCVWGAGSVAVVLAVAVAKSVAPTVGARVLSVPAVIALCAASLVNLLMQSMACYLRAHKQEPYVGVSILTAVLMVCACWVTARYGSPIAMAFAYALVTATVQLPVAAWIFSRKRREWHVVTAPA